MEDGGWRVDNDDDDDGGGGGDDVDDTAAENGAAGPLMEHDDDADADDATHGAPEITAATAATAAQVPDAALLLEGSAHNAAAFRNALFYF